MLNGTGVQLHAELAHRTCSNILYRIIYCLLDNSILQNFASQKFHNLHGTVMETGLFPRVKAEHAGGQCSESGVAKRPSTR